MMELSYGKSRNCINFIRLFKSAIGYICVLSLLPYKWHLTCLSEFSYVCLYFIFWMLFLWKNVAKRIVLKTPTWFFSIVPDVCIKSDFSSAYIELKRGQTFSSWFLHLDLVKSRWLKGLHKINETMFFFLLPVHIKKKSKKPAAINVFAKIYLFVVTYWHCVILLPFYVMVLCVVTRYNFNTIHFFSLFLSSAIICNRSVTCATNP